MIHDHFIELPKNPAAWHVAPFMLKHLVIVFEKLDLNLPFTLSFDMKVWWIVVV